MKTKVLGALVCALVVSSAFAGPVVTGFTGGSSFGGYYSGVIGDVVGFRFTADDTLRVTDLGILEDPLDGVLDVAHMVGLWRNSDQALLASASVGESGTHLNGFVYEPISPVILTAGEQYTLGAMYLITDGDGYISSPSTISLDGISGTNGVFPASVDLGFVYPTENSTNLARLGPNAIAEVVPEPASLALLALGCLAVVRRR